MHQLPSSPHSLSAIIPPPPPPTHTQEGGKEGDQRGDGAMMVSRPQPQQRRVSPVGHHRGFPILLRLLLLLLVQQTLPPLLGGTTATTAMLKASHPTALVGFLLAPQAAQAQASVTLSVTAGTSQATLSWSDSGGLSTLMQYRYKESGKAYSDWITASRQSVTVTGLTNNIAYVFQVRVYDNLSNIYVNSSEVTATPAALTTLAAPTDLSAEAGNRQVVLTWTKPAGLITGYKLRYAKTPAKASASWSAMTGSGAATVRHTVTGLDNDAEYSFMIRAVNAAGDGAATSWVTATPTSPITLTATPGNATIALSWTYTGSTTNANKWQVEYFAGSTGDQWRDIPGGVAVRSVSLPLTGRPALNNDETYNIRIRLVTSGGETIAETVVGNAGWVTAALTSPGPAAPTGLSAKVGNAQVVLSWTDPKDATITHYEYRQKSSSGYGEWTDMTSSGASTTSYTVGSLTNNTAYTFQIRAVNNDGNGGASGEVRATPKANILAAEAGDGQVTLTFTVTNTNGDGYNRWGYQQKESGRSWTGGERIGVTPTSGGGTYTKVVKGLNNGTKYCFRAGVDYIDVVNNPSPVLAYLSNEVCATPMAPTTSGVTITPTSLTVEEGSSGEYTVVLDTAPSASVTVTVAGASGEVTVTNPPLTFSPTNWDTTKTVVVNAGTDADASNDSATLTHSSASTDSNYGASLSIDNVSVTVTDTTPTLQLLTNPAAVSEGENISLTVTSDMDLTGDVTVKLTLAARSSSSFDADDIDGALGPRDFTASFGSTGSKTGTVSIATSSDATTEGAEAYRITLNDGTGYVVGTDKTADGTLNDAVAPATPGVTIAPKTLTVTEATGATQAGTYTVVLDSDPGATVTVTPVSSDPAAATVSAALTFDSSDWETAQTVTVTGVSDGDTANETVTVSHAVVGYGSGASAVTTADNVTVTVTDAGGSATAGVRVLPVRLSLTEEGAKGKYTVVLNTAPSATATVTPTSSAPTKVTVSPATLTFDSSDYSTAQTVTVTAEDDADIDDHEGITISHGVTGYGSVSSGETVTVDVTDNDEVVAPVLTAATSPTSGEIRLTWTHSGSSAGELIDGGVSSIYWEISHRLRGKDNWLMINDPSNTRGVSRRSVTYGLGVRRYPNGASIQVRIRAIDGANRKEGPLSNVRTITSYKNTTTSALTITGGPVSVTAGEEATYTVALTKAYDGTLSITSANTDKATVSPGSLDFTTGNYNVAQTVRVTGVAEGSATINHAFRLTGASVDAIPDAGTVSVTVNAVSAGPAAPTGVKAKASNGGVVLSWSDPKDATITHYEYRQKSSSGYGAWTDMSGSGASTTNYTVGSLSNGTAYTFRIRAVNDDGDGAVSAEVTATPTTKTIRLSASSTSIEEGNSGKKDVTINITLGEAAPLGGGIDFVFAFDSSSTGKMNNNYNSDSCTNPNPADADMCWGNNGTVVTIATSSTTGNWTFGIIGDTTEEEDETIVLTVDADGAAATAWDGDSITITIVDDDGSTPGVTVSPTSLTVTEATGAGQTAEYTVVLDTDPSGTVTVTPVSGTPAAATVSAALTFDSSDWSAEQTVTVTGVDDTDRTDETVTVTHTVKGYGSGATAVTTADSVTVTVTDDDVPAKPTGLSATGGNAQVTLDWSDPEDESITGYELRQKKGGAAWSGWSAIADSDDETVSHTVTGLENGSRYRFGIRAVNSNGNSPESEVVQARPTAPTTPGVTIDPTSLTVTEATGAGQTGEYTVVLDTDPGGTVTVTPVSGTPAAATVSAALTFDSSDWETAQTVTVTGVDDTDRTDETVTVTHTVKGYGSGPTAVTSADSVTVTVTDDDVPAKPTGLSATVGNAQVTLNWSDPEDESITGYELRQKKGSAAWGDWSAIADSDDETVSYMVTGLENGSRYRFRIRAVNSNGDGAQSEVVEATPTAPTTPGVTVSPTSLTVTEATGAGQTGEYTVVLDTDPGGTVTVTPASSDEAAATVSAALVFDSTNWETAKTVTVTGVDDTDRTDETVTVTHTVKGYGSGPTAVTSADSVTVTVTDDDVPAKPTGLSATVGNAQVTLNWSDPEDESITGYELRQKKGSAAWGDWSAIADSDDETVSYMVTGLENGSRYRFRIRAVNSNGDGAQSEVVEATPTAPTTPGVTVSPTSLTVTEATGAGQTGEYTVVLDTDPGGTVTVTPASSDEAAATVSAALVFDSTNWETAKTVTVTGVDDTDRTDETVTVTHTVTDYGSGPTAVTSADSVTVTVTDDDVPAKPTGLSATAGNAQVTLNWSDPKDESITGYELRQKKGSAAWGDWSAIADSDDETVSYMVTGLENGSRYRFRIRAVNSNGDGAESEVVDATPTAPTTPGVTVSPTSLTVEEGSSGEYTVVLDTAPSASVTVTVAGTSGEVTVTGSPVIFSTTNWITAKTVTVNAGADADATNDSATLTHSSASTDSNYGASLSIDNVSVTVTDTTPTLQLLTDPAAVREGENISLTVTSDKDLTGDVTVKLLLAARSSSSFDADDITGPLGPRDFTASFGSTGSKTGTVSIATSRDAVVEGAEAYRITLNDRSGYVVGTDKTADGTLNDGTIALSIGDVSAAEDGTFSFTVTASPTPSSPVTFKYKVTKESTDTAIAGTDFTEVSSATAKTIAANAASTTITVTVTDDNLDEANETFTVTLSEPSVGVRLADATATGTITDDDNSPVLADIANETIKLGQAVDITAAATDADSGDTISYTWTRKAGETIPALPGSTSLNQARLAFTTAAVGTYTMTVTANDGNGNSASEEVVIRVTTASVVSVPPTVMVTEGDNTAARVRITTTDAFGESVTFTVSYQDSSAVGAATLSAGDYENDAVTSVTFNARDTSKNINIPLYNDRTDEDDETFRVSIAVSGSLPASYEFGNQTTTVTIKDNDPMPSLSIASPAAVTEGDSSSTDMVFTVTLVPTSGRQVTVDYGVDAATTATATADFTDLAGTLTFAAGDTSKSITVAVTGDAVDEPNETVVLKLSDASNATIGTATASGTITDDDDASWLSIAAPAAVTEGNSGSTDMVFTVTLAPTSGQQVSVDYGVDATSTATADTDFTDLAGTLTFAAGDTSKSITVAVTGDVVDEPNETVVLKLSNPTNASITTDKATGTINDDDGDPSLTITAPSAAVTEGNSGSTDMVFTVTLAPTSGQQVSVDYGVDATSTATADTDFTDLAGTLTFAAGDTSKSITVAVTGDVVDEPNETVVLKLSNPTNASITTDKATGTINDDDNAPVLADIANQSIKLGEPVAITASANDADGDNISYRWRVGENTPALPQGTVLNAAQLSFTPPAVGTYTMTVTASDGNGNTDSEEAVITVGLPGVTIAPTTLALAEGGEPKSYTVALDTLPTGTVTITPASEDAGAVTLSPAALSFSPSNWDTAQAVTVTAQHDDDITDEEDVIITNTVSGANYSGVTAESVRVTVTDDDTDDDTEDRRQTDVRKQDLAAFSRATMGIATDMIGSRIGGDLSGGGAGGSIGEQASGLMENLLGYATGSELSSKLSLEQVGEQLWNQSFHISQSANDSNAPQQGRGTEEQHGRWSLWGAGELRSFQGKDASDAEDHSYSGSIKAAWLGVDYQLPNPWLAGLAVSFSSAESDYTYQSAESGTGAGKMKTQLTTFYPYGSAQLTERLKLWGTAGVGFGDLRHQDNDDDDSEDEGELKVHLGAIGFEQKLSPLASWNIFSLAGDLAFVQSSTQWQDGALNDQSVSITRVRLGVNSSFPLSETTKGYMNLRGRLDGGDLQMGAAEMVLGLRYSAGRFSALLQGRQTSALDATYSESGLLGELRFSSQQDGTGLALQLQPSYGPYGQLEAQQASLTDDQQMQHLNGWGGQTPTGAMALNTTIGYGFRLPDSNLLLTPFAEVAFTEASRQQTTLGITMEGPSWEVKLSGSREAGSTSAPNGTLKLMFSKQL